MGSNQRRTPDPTLTPDVTDAALTGRERDVLRLVNEGLTNSQVAGRLGITRDAVRYHLKELHSKLETGSEREALRSSRLPRLLSWIGVGLGVARTEVVATVALGAVALAGAGAAYIVWDRTDTPVATEAIRPCNANDTGPCLITVNSGSFAGYNVTLADLAHASQTSEAELRRLNPGLGPGVITAGYEIVLPVAAGSGVQMLQPTPPAHP